MPRPFIHEELPRRGIFSETGLLGYRLPETNRGGSGALFDDSSSVLKLLAEPLGG